MLLILAYLLLITASTFLAGSTVWRMGNVLLGYRASTPAFPSLCLFGLAAQMLAVSWWVLFFPVGDGISWFIVLAPFASLASKGIRAQALESLRWARSLPRLTWEAFALFFLGLILKASSPTEIFDDGIAHLPVIASIRQAGTVIGLANLHPNFGYNTHSTLAQALYSLPTLFGNPLHAFNAWLAMICGLLLFSKLGRRNESITALGLAAGLLPLLVLRSQITGLSSDPGHYLLAWVILMEWAIAPDSRKDLPGLFWFGVLAALALTFKINAMPLLILGLFWAWNTWKARQDGRLVLAALVLVALILLPWLLRNALLTGYLYLLLPQTALPVDWRVPAEVLRRLTEQVTGEVFHGGNRFSISYWLLWAQKAGLQNTILLLASLAGLVLLAIKARLEKGLIPLAMTLAAGLALWLATVTEPRYAHAWLAPLAALSIGSIATYQSGSVLRVSRQVIMLLILLAAFINLAKSFGEFVYWPEVALAPAPRPEVAWEARQLQGRPVYLPVRYTTPATNRMRVTRSRAYEVENNLCGCWNTPFPCLYRRQDLEHLQWRGATLRDGFRWRQ